MPARQLNATAASLLGLLHEGPMTGWDLMASAQRRIGNFWTLTQSQVYRELAALTRDGLVRPGDPGPRDRKPYELTAAGREAFTGWLDREPDAEQIRFPLLLTLAFAEHLPAGRLAEIVAARRTVHEQRLRDYEARHRELVAAGADATALFTLDFGLRHERATLDWFDHVARQLD